MRSVHAVPAPHLVQGVEERAEGLCLAASALGRRVVVGGVERPDGRPVEQARRRPRRGAQRGSRTVAEGFAAQRRRQVRDAGVMGPGQYPATGGGPTGEQVHPAHRVPVGVVGALHQLQCGVEVAGAVRVHAHVRGLHGVHGQARGGDDAGEAHPPDRGPEQVGVAVVGADFEGFASGGEERQGTHVGADGGVDVVVLAVDVGGDRPAQGDVPGPGGDGKEVSSPQQVRHESAQAGAGRCGDLAAVGIEPGRPGEFGAVQDESAGGLGGVAVGTPQSAGQGPAWSGLGQRLGGLFGGARAHHGGGGGGGAAPPGEEGRSTHRTHR